jgi:hypothetical protein
MIRWPPLEDAVIPEGAGDAVPALSAFPGQERHLNFAAQTARRYISGGILFVTSTDYFVL